MVTLMPITEKNLYQCLALSVAEHQERYVASNAFSLAEAWMYGDVARPFAIYDEDRMVGFFMGSVEPEKPYFSVWRLLIDKAHQHKGYGRKALLLAIDYLKAQGAKEIFLSYAPENQVAAKLYASVGFQLTGGVEDDGEVIAKLVVA